MPHNKDRDDIAIKVIQSLIIANGNEMLDIEHAVLNAYLIADKMIEHSRETGKIPL